MSLPKGEQYQAQDSSGDFVLPFSLLHRDMLALVGGKAANLGKLTNAKFPVPPGFCVTTEAYALVAADAGLRSGWRRWLRLRATAFWPQPSQ